MIRTDANATEVGRRNGLDYARTRRAGNSNRTDGPEGGESRNERLQSLMDERLQGEAFESCER
jgi:hypothetical protein